VREIFVVFEPEWLTADFLADKTAVVMDVLRATSSMLAALANGATRVVPTMEVSEARELKATLPAGTVVLGGERGGLQIDGFDVGNTPQEFAPAVVGGKTVVMTTTNGTRAILMSLGAPQVYVAAINNVGATARALAERCRGDVVLVASGTERRISWEDSFCAGAIVERLAAEQRGGPWQLTDSAMIAQEIWQVAKRDIPAALRRGRGGRNVMKFNFDAAFAVCGALDCYDFAARVHHDPLEIVVEKS